jgi:uncharacterized protein YndB with AHSA1/START domain
MTYTFELSDTIEAPAERIYDAWMSSEGHAAMTGGAAHIDASIGGEYDAWDGYITGKTLELEPGRRILQTWRTSEFGPDDADSTIEVLFEPSEAGTVVTIRHTGVPDGQLAYEESGWRENYFEPMRDYFES